MPRSTFTITLDDKSVLEVPWFHRPPIYIWRRLKQHVYKQDKGCCRYCGEKVPYEHTHCHHTLALSNGGTNHPQNLKTSCYACHTKKHPFMDPVASLGLRNKLEVGIEVRIRE